MHNVISIIYDYNQIVFQNYTWVSLFKQQTGAPNEDIVQNHLT